MTSPHDPFTSAEIQSELRKAMAHDQIRVKPFGKHFLIQMVLGEEVETVARITALTSRTFGVAYRTHAGRWEPLPAEGSLEDMIKVVYTDLAAYLTLGNY